MENVLIISLDIPFPDNYGGAKDIWWRVKALERKYNLDLISTYNDESRKTFFLNSEAKSIFSNVVFIKRTGFARIFLTCLPYAVDSRRIQLKDIDNLSIFFKKDYHTVIVEGFHSILTFEDIRERLSYKQSVLRVHNLENEYYLNLYKNESNLFKKLYYLQESFKFDYFIKKYDFKKRFDALLFISNTDLVNQLFEPIRNKYFIPPIVDSVYQGKSYNDRKNYFLYVGNLNSSDNVNSVLKIYAILKNIIMKYGFKLIICGRCNNPKRFSSILGDKNVILKLNVGFDELNELYVTSKIFFIYSENPSGVKLKLIEALSYALPVLSNTNGVIGSGFEDLTINIEKFTSEGLVREIVNLMYNENLWLLESHKIEAGFDKMMTEKKGQYNRIIAF